MTASVLVLQDRFGVAWPAEAGKTPAQAERLPLAEALTRIYPTDAHTAGYDSPAHLFRLKKEAASEARPAMTTLLVDVDAHAAHSAGKAASPAWWEAEKLKIEKLRAEHPGIVAYRTRGGYRLVTRLAVPFIIDSPAAADSWRRWYARAILGLFRDFEIVGDPSCGDFTRLYRLPHTNRGGRAPENWPVVGDLAAVGAFDWSPVDGDLGEDIAAAEMLSKRADVVAPQGWGGLAFLLKPKAPSRPAMPALSPSAARLERYWAAALDSAASKVASTPPGGRNGVLNSEAFSVGRLVAGGVVPESVAARVLAAAGVAAGLSEGEARASARSGLEAGQRHPRALPEPTFRSVGALALAPVAAEVSTPEVFTPITAEELLLREFPARKNLLSPLITAKSLTMVYARRGVGKTWLVEAVALAVSSGGIVFDPRGTGPAWGAPAPQEVLLVDGEMPGSMIKNRLAALMVGRGYDPGGRLRILAADLFEEHFPSISSPEGFAIVDAHIGDAKLVIFDNVSTLFSGLDENDAQAWDPVQRYLLSLRRRGLAVLLVHHGGKGGQQRGTSKREDVLDNVISLKVPEDAIEEEGIRVHVVFEKARGLAGKDVEAFEARLAMDDGAARWEASALTDPDDEAILAKSRAGRSSREISKALGIDKATVNRRIKRLTPRGGA